MGEDRRMGLFDAAALARRTFDRDSARRVHEIGAAAVLPPVNVVAPREVRQWSLLAQASCPARRKTWVGSGSVYEAHSPTERLPLARRASPDLTAQGKTVVVPLP